MATATPNTALTSQAPPPTDSEIIAQLATLQSLHDKIFQLRSLLPERLIDPIKAAFDGHETPAALAAHLRSVAVDGDRDVKEFKERWRSEGMKDVWAKGKGEAFPQGSDVWSVDYGVMVEKERSDEKGDTGMDEQENVDQVLETFRRKHPKVKVERRGGADGDIILDVTVAGYTFIITRPEDVEKLLKGRWLIAPETKAGLASVYLEIRRSLQVRPNHKSLKYLLEMIASYTDLKTRPCEKCHDIFDDDVQLPAVRLANPKAENGSTDFLAYHRGCL